MSDPRIIDVELDERTILWRSADIEQERRIAIFDLIEGNYFAPQREHHDGYAGPYRLSLAVEEGRLAIGIAREDGSHLETLILAMGRFRRPIRDYFAICDSYFQAIRQSTPQQIETVDMARRAIHKGPPRHPQRGGGAAEGAARRQDRDRFRYGAPPVHADLRAPHQGLTEGCGGLGDSR